MALSDEIEEDRVRWKHIVGVRKLRGEVGPAIISQQAFDPFAHCRELVAILSCEQSTKRLLTARRSCRIDADLRFEGPGSCGKEFGVLFTADEFRLYGVSHGGILGPSPVRLECVGGAR